MKHLFKHWLKFSEILSDRHIMLFLDYDGTLAPIAKGPKYAVMPAAVKKTLKRLAEISDINIAIISGRAVEDIRKLVGLKNIIYVGNHGFQIEGPKIKFTSKALYEYKITLGRIKEELSKKLSGIYKGIFIEDKGITLAVHYRLAAKKDASAAKTIFHEALIFNSIQNKVKIRTGKMLLEIRPPVNWDKGKAALWLLARQQFKLRQKNILPVYIGDDRTDEDAFKALRNRGLTVFVGKGSYYYSAEYYLKDPNEVSKFLRRLLELKKDVK